jgi:hypothetical protein
VLVLVQDVDLDARDLEVGVLVLLVEVEDQDLVLAQLVTRDRRAAVDGHLAVADLTAQEPLGKQGKREAQELVELHAGAFGRDREVQHGEGSARSRDQVFSTAGEA